MVQGDLVVADEWVSHVGGKTGVVIKVLSAVFCVGAYVLFTDFGIKLVRVENLKVILEGK